MISEKIPKKHRAILVGLMLPAMLMPLLSTMSRVALPVVRDQFALNADVAAWIDVSFTMPFMMLMPVLGRLSDHFGTRRLLLTGIAMYTLGTGIVLQTTQLSELLLGRAIQGFGLSGMMPLCISLITSLFPPQQRGLMLGTWSTVGPLTGFLGPLLAGFIISKWGWEAAFIPPLFSGLVGLVVISRTIPKTEIESPVTNRSLLYRFDWLGVLLLAGTACTFIFFLSSEPITGVEAMKDVRLIFASAVLMIAFLVRVYYHSSPFLPKELFENKTFLIGTFAATMRMVSMGTIGFLIPLYLVDIKGIPIVKLGGILMIGAGSMTLIVRIAGGLADRIDGRWLVIVGLLGQATTLFAFSRFPSETSIWYICSALSLHGFSAGLMLATLHKIVMSSVEEIRAGAAAGLYGMFRFLGAATGTALAGVLLQLELDTGASIIEAYRVSFFAAAGFPLLGVLVSCLLKKNAPKK